MAELYIEAVKEVNKGRRVAICTIVEKVGSAPRDLGAKILVYEDGRSYGTLGGGEFEQIVVGEALKAIEEGLPKTITISLGLNRPSKDSIKTQHICGGEVKVFIDVISPRPKLVIFGAGNVAQALSKIASFLNFSIWIVDSNEEYANPQRFPDAEKIIVREDLEEALNIVKKELRRGDFVVVAHGRVDYDYEAVKKVLETEVSYVGLLAGKRKALEFYKKLREEGLKNLQRLHAPIGLNICSDTPEEVAVSIVAEIIKLYKKCRGRADHLTLAGRVEEG